MKRYRCGAIVSLLLLLPGCATNTGVVGIGPNTYMMTKSSAAGAFANMSKLDASVIQEANNFADSKGMVVIPISAVETRPAMGYPSFTYQFRLVPKDSPEASENHGPLVIERSVPTTEDIRMQAAKDALAYDLQHPSHSPPPDVSIPIPKPRVVKEKPTPLPTQMQLEMDSLWTGQTKLADDNATWYEYRRTDGSTYWSNRRPR